VVGSADALEWSPNIDKDDVGRHPGLHGDQFQPTPWFQKAMTKIFTTFLWTGIEVAHGGKCLVAVQRPFISVALGMMDFNLLDRTLRL
jgi:hypothetical protein